MSSAIPQLTEALVNSGRMVSRVATAMLDGISRSCLWWKSGRTTGAAARSRPDVARFSVVSESGSAGALGLSKTCAGAPGRRSGARSNTVTSTLSFLPS